MIIQLAIPATLSGVDPYIFCSPTARNYTPNSQFENNLKQLLESLSSNTSISGGFYNTTIGNNTDRVYGQALCRGDVNSTVCRNCVYEASQELFKSCNTNDAMIWYEVCQVRYSFQMFFSLMVYIGNYPKQDSREKRVSNPGDLWACCSSSQGGAVVGRNCNVRFEMFRFFDDMSSSLLIYPYSEGDKRKTLKVVLISASTFLLAFLIVCCNVHRQRKKGLEELKGTLDGNMADANELIYLAFMDLAAIRVATDDFSDSNKLGQGGFGTVYKGLLQNGKEVAVKRLSRKSWQGLEEFKNEVILIAKLQHRNLVRLLACGFEGEEKLLLYEFMPNKSLDTFIFDSERRAELNWKTYYNIIEGIARGLLYLHEDSRLRIIHRDLKPSNVLLDHEMVAKISDFGLARIFCERQNPTKTRRVVGTYGYMAPEYAMEGLFSVKSDVFSFGVILLEIISGKRNSGFYLTEHAKTLIAYAWRLWKAGKELEFVEPLLMESCTKAEVLRCMHIALLCVQEDPAERPTMSAVVVLLGSESVDLPEPKQPAIFAVRRVLPVNESITDPSANGLTMSIIAPR
ncbi:hypothetical protein Pyn_27904 [Prunus yedoensis var. nudiflora]|uniref:non-specific serine/threonine protein kinase n=1 Tax=Prunus yedoensis var. nudiflora TaxID=2094558 RepID=A0A314Z9J5_PRUYE|nr:hypothetical protein Pyn_27904 [Prunus yedoensis var. nudiflora]